MGRIRITLVKRAGENLLKKYPDRFQANFEENKKVVSELAEIHSKKLRNVIAGYITHLKKNNEQ